MSILTVDNITKSYGVRKIFDGASFFLQEGEKAGIIGINGTGKSTLLKIIAGLEETDDGTVIKANHCLVRYLPQNPEFAPEETVLEAVLRGNRVEENAGTIEADAKSMLTKLGVTEFDQPCGQLSGGQRKRLALVSVLLSPAEILLLDEPTNHLDIYTRENLTEALMAYTGTLLLVTHDRHLMNSLACPILYLEDGKAVIYPSYDALMGRAAPAPVAEKSSEPAKAGYGKEQRRRRAELRAKIKACEDEMEACGAREVELENEINSPEVYNDPQLLREKSDELSDLRFHQDELFAAWEAAVEEQEQYEQTAGGEE